MFLEETKKICYENFVMIWDYDLEISESENNNNVVESAKCIQQEEPSHKSIIFFDNDVIIIPLEK